MHTRHNGHILTDPDIVADHGIALQRQFIFYRSDGAAPLSAHYVERIGRHAIHSVVGPVHHELNAFGDGAELPDNQFVADEIVEVCYVFLKLVRTIHVIIVCVVPDDDTGILYHILDKAKTRDLRIWKSRVRIRPC